MTLDPERVPSPSFVCELEKLERNLRILREVHERSGARILLALKGFALWSTFPLCARYLHGTTASSLDEARLGREEFGGEVHAYAPAYADHEIEAYADLVDHLSFNSVAQWKRFRDHSRLGDVSLGLRIHPGYSEIEVELYDPCARYSRLGVRREQLDGVDLAGLEGLHFHSLCEQGADVLARTLDVVERDFGPLFDGMRWANFGGGHHITRPDYDVDLLCARIREFRDAHGVEVYLEPGEAIGLETGGLVSTVLDIVHNEIDIAILDVSATAHMPDVLEMPYRPRVTGAGEPGDHPHLYRLGGLSCLAGDVVGDYSFPRPLRIGDRVVFEDMIHYTMVKTTTFNGVRLPSIVLYDAASDEIRVVRTFDYPDYRNRLS